MWVCVGGMRERVCVCDSSGCPLELVLVSCNFFDPSGVATVEGAVTHAVVQEVGDSLVAGVDNGMGM